MFTLALLAACGGTTKLDTSVDDAVPPSAPALVVNEFMAMNTTVVADAAGEFDDWVELYNAGSEPVSLAGIHLSDDPALAAKFALPADLTLAPGAWTVIWCDDHEEQGVDHAGFKLAADGGYIGLHLVADGFDPVLVDSLDYAAQADDVSMARAPDGSANWESDASPTPGASNGGG
jgi:hypothetical protein